VRPVASRRAAVAASLAAAVIAAVVVIVVIAPGGGRPGTRAHRPAPPPPTGPSPVPASPSAPEFGASANLLFNVPGIGAAQLDAQLSALAATGATLARSDALWEVSEPAPPVSGVHSYQWIFDDIVAGSLASHHLRWLPIIDYSAGWAQSIPGQDHSPPRSSADYAAYAAALASRYGLGGSFWRDHRELPALPVQAFEIWNEPDSGFFWVPRPDLARYGRLYTAARDAIHAVDPSARAIVGGLAAPSQSTAALLAADPQLAGRIDGVGIHPYAGSPAAVLENVAGTRRVLDRLGLQAVPLYVTEFGWTTSPPGAMSYLPAALRPGYIESTLAAIASSGCRVAATVLYTWFSPDRDLRNAQDWFGISPPGAGAGPDVTAFTSGLRQAQRARPHASCP
jgi:hypothetical protein